MNPKTLRSLAPPIVPPQGSKRFSRTPLTIPEATGMVSELARLFHAEARDASRSVDRKYAATSLGIVTDKFLLLTNRPTTIHGFVDAELARPAMREIGLMLAAAKREMSEGVA